MNTPNKLTVFRMFLTPVFLAALLIDFKYHLFASLAVFVIASLTDMLDGKIARRKGIITNFGKFLDPIADKVLTTSAFIGFVCLAERYDGGRFGRGIVWITFIVITREFLVASIRMLASANGKVVAADKAGKAKTVTQMAAIITVLAFEGIMSAANIPAEAENLMVVIYNILLWVSAVMTVISGINYTVNNKEFIDYHK